VGPISAAKLVACDPSRFKSEAAFARCNGTAPQPASSGQTIRHRLSRSGDRQANNAIHTIALSRSINHAESRAYLNRKTSEGKTRREAMRSLKRQVSRRLYHQLTQTPLTPEKHPCARHDSNPPCPGVWSQDCICVCR
jgi:transposase